jgi:ubiquinone/menaquinone biosynthesis C-methylase UbiE
MDLNKFTYAQVVKINNIELNIDKKKINQNKILFITKKDRIKILINKILKNYIYINCNKKHKIILKDIYDIIIKCDNNKLDLINSIISINKLLLNNKLKNQSQYDINPSHNYVGLNLSNIISNLISKSDIKSDINILDIGGGEGNILNIIGNKLNIPFNNLYCLETNDDTWYEKYNLTNRLNYLIWDNININLKDDSFDVIIIMVTMHHMNEHTLYNLLPNINRLLKKNGIIIIKEHDAINQELTNIIDWEHHLYHIFKSKENDFTENNLTKYLTKFINNYKSKLKYDEIFKSYNFIPVKELDRQFKSLNNYDLKNVTNLYWKIYSKL